MSSYFSGYYLGTYPTFHIFILLTDFALGAREGVNDLCAHRAPSNDLYCGAKASQHMEWRSEGEENPRKRLALPRTFPVRYGVAPCLPCILAFPEVRRAAVRAEGVQESPTFAALGFSGLKCPNQPEWLIILDSTWKNMHPYGRLNIDSIPETSPVDNTCCDFLRCWSCS